MESVSFTCATKELRPLIAHLFKLVPSKMRRATSIEIRIQPQYVSFHTPGAERKLFCPTAGWGSFTLSLPYFNQLVQDHGKEVFHAEFKGDELNLGGLFTKGIFTPIQSTHPEMRPSLDLPVNFRDIELLRLHWQGRAFDKSILNADQMIEVAEKRMEANVQKAYEVLREYDIRKDEIIAWIRAKALKPGR
jgi:hypothetical protein